LNDSTILMLSFNSFSQNFTVSKDPILNQFG
jgi:hypothetical protein